MSSGILPAAWTASTCRSPPCAMHDAPPPRRPAGSRRSRCWRAGPRRGPARRSGPLQSRRKPGQVDDALAVDRNALAPRPAGEPVPVEHARVLGRADEEQRRAPASPARRSDGRQHRYLRLRAAAGEDDVPGAARRPAPRPAPAPSRRRPARRGLRHAPRRGCRADASARAIAAATSGRSGDVALWSR